MKIIKPIVELLAPLNINELELYKMVEIAGRTCYKSEDKITQESSIEFVRKMIKNGHHAIIEHAPSISIKFICDRGVTHEIVRHRLFSFAQESTRYCNYGKSGECMFILPCFFDTGMGTASNSDIFDTWKHSCMEAEDAYLKLLKYGASPQEARTVLPNSLKTEIIVTGNVREWRHFFTLRCATSAHPQMQQVAKMAFKKVYNAMPVFFEDLKGIEI